MRSINLLTLLFFFGFSTKVFSQSKAIQISFKPIWDQVILHLDDSAFTRNDSSNLQIEVLKFYISNIQFLKGGNLVLQEKNSFHLIDAADEKTWKISIENHKDVIYDEVRYSLGIDSSTNDAGVLGGDLDPMKGMYWTWQSGYINFKLEGKSALCKTRNEEFVFHLGGYQQPFYALQTVSLPVSNARPINLRFNVQQFLRQIDLVHLNHIMSPGEDAVRVSSMAAHSFFVIEE